jgi:serine protease
VLSTYPTSYGGYAYLSGTSMASPHVAGVAALLVGKNPTATAAKIVAAMTSTAQDLGAVGRDNSYGYGLVNAQAALAKV